jgi:predicted small lipoprotein YifL
MKKLLAILLAVLMVMSLAACGSEKADDETDAPKIEETTTPVTEPEEEELPSYEPAIDIFCDILLGDVTDLEKTLPEEVWLVAAKGLDTDKQGAIDELASSFVMLDGIFTSMEYEVVSEKDAADEIEDIQEFLADYGLETEIEAAYVLELSWKYEMAETYDAEDDGEEETAYAILVDGEWYLLSETYEWYVLS